MRSNATLPSSLPLAFLLPLVLPVALAASPQTAGVRPTAGPDLPQSAGGRSPGAPASAADASPAPMIAPERATGGPDYRIGADDQLAITVLQAPELNTTARVSEQGAISLPLLGSVRAGGLTTLELEHAIEEQYAQKYIKNPEVTVQVTDLRSHPVSVVGAVRRPGILQVRGSTTLLEVLSLAGGVADDAGDAVVVLRKGPSEVSSTEVKLKALMELRDPRLNVAIHPGDVVNVRGADVIYVVGAVKKPGAYAMPGNDRVTVLRALALGEGLTPLASHNDALVVRTVEGRRVEIPVDLGAVLRGKAQDVPLEAHDVLFVPISGSKAVARVALEAFVRVISWRPF